MSSCVKSTKQLEQATRDQMLISAQLLPAAPNSQQPASQNPAAIAAAAGGGGGGGGGRAQGGARVRARCSGVRGMVGIFKTIQRHTQYYSQEPGDCK